MRRGVVKEELAMAVVLSSSKRAVKSADGWPFELGIERKADIVRSRVLERGMKMGMKETRPMSY